MHHLCLIGRHVYANEWTLRPAWVGAGISIELVHFDRTCTRCKHSDALWVEIQGDRTPLDEPLHLSEWLTRHSATVEKPAGTIRLPEGGTF